MAETDNQTNHEQIGLEVGRRALHLMNEAFMRAGVFSLDTLVLTQDDRRLRGLFLTRAVRLMGWGLDTELRPDMYYYGPGSDGGFYTTSEVVVLKTSDPAPAPEDDPYPEFPFVERIRERPVAATLEDGTTIDLTFRRVFASVAMAYALQDGREDDVRVLEDWYQHIEDWYQAAVREGEASTAAAEDGGESAPSIDTIKPNRHLVPNAKTSHVLTSPDLFCSGGAALDVGRKIGQLSIDFELDFDDDAPEAITTLSQPIDREDVRVIAAITTLKSAGNNVISPLQIAENMGYDKPSRDLQEEVHQRVMKLRQIDGRIDWTEQAKRYHILNPETGLPFTKAEITGHLVEAVVFHGVDGGGNEYTRYQLGAYPITYQHAHQIGQVVDYPQRLLNETKPLDESGRYAKRMTREQTNVADAILWFVYSLKNPKSKLNATITYDRLFEHAGYEPRSTRARQRMVKFVSDYLRALQAQEVVYGFTANTIGRQGKANSVTVAARQPNRRAVKKPGRA